MRPGGKPLKHECKQEKAAIPTHTLPQRLEALAGHWSIPLLLALSFFALHSIGLDRSPLPLDDVLFSNAAYHLAFHGRFAAPVLGGAAYLGSHFFLQPPGFFVVLALVYKLLGFGIWQTRLVSLAFGALGIGLLYLVARRLYGSALAGLAAAALVWGDPSWIYTSRAGRMDPMAVALGMTSLLVLLFAGRMGQCPLRQRLLVFFSGLLGGMAVMTGPRAAFVVLGTGLVLLVAPGFGSIRERFKGGGAFALGVLLPALGWLPYILSAPDAFSAQFIPHMKGASHVWSEPWLPRSGLQALSLFWLWGPVAIGGTIFAFSRPSVRAPYGRSILALLFAVTPLITLARVWSNVITYYIFVFAIPAGGLVAYVLKQVGARRPVIASLVLAMVTLMALSAPLARLGVVVAQWEARAPQRVEKALAPYLEPPCTVAGEHLF